MDEAGKGWTGLDGGLMRLDGAGQGWFEAGRSWMRRDGAGWSRLRHVVL